MFDSICSRTPESVKVIESAVKPVANCVLVGLNPVLPDQLIPANSTARVCITSWESPFKFYIQLRSLEADCAEMLIQLEKFYRNRSPVQQRPPIGSLVVFYNKKDQNFQRGQIVDYNEARNKYKVRSIDFGNMAIYQQTDLYEFEQSFVRMFPIAICCTFGNVIMNKPKQEIVEKIESYDQIRQANQSNQIECEFGCTKDGKTQVEILIDGKSLRELLVEDQQIVNLPKSGYFIEKLYSIVYVR